MLEGREDERKTLGPACVLYYSYEAFTNSLPQCNHNFPLSNIHVEQHIQQSCPYTTVQTMISHCPL